MTEKIAHFRDLKDYRVAFECAMEIFKITKNFPSEEKYSLVDQMRRSSRSVCTNIAEAWRKRKYPKIFENKLTDAMQEASETQSWLEFSLACGYVTHEFFLRFDKEYEGIIGMLTNMDLKSAKFCY